ncbi:MAG: amidohydrolase family protein [Lachnospiraceae bacterium]|nr:amidohydrolase family protein [Lachnospiraceae bacterium]
MKQIIFKGGKYLTLDKKIPTMNAVLITDGTITASADAFILEEIAPDAEVIDLKGKTLIPAFTETCSSFYKTAFELLSDGKYNSLNDAIAFLSNAYLNAGITTAAVPNIGYEDYELLRAADEAGALNIDLAVYFDLSAAEALLPSQLAVDNSYTSHIRPAGVSIVVDNLTSETSLTETFADIIGRHYQAMVFVDSRDAIDIALNSYRDALIAVNGSKTMEDGEEKPKIYEDLRPIIVGGAYLDNSQLTLLQSLGFTVSFSHDNIYSRGDEYLSSLESDIYENLYPLRSIVKRGMAFSVSHFESVGVPDECATMFVATHRNTSGGMAVGFEQSINTDQALFAQTLFGSYQLFEDLYKGSLTMTKKADLVVLDNNPLEQNADTLKSTHVVMTVKNGEIVYKA